MGRRHKFYKPEKDIIYHFAFSNGKTQWFRFFGENNKGRLVYCNVDTGFFGNMSPERFSYLFNKQLLEMKKVINQEEKEKSMLFVQKKEMTVMLNDDTTTDKEINIEIKGIIDKLKGITDQQLINQIKERVGRTPKYLAKELYDCWGSKPGTYDIRKQNEIFHNYIVVKDLIALKQCAVLANV